MWNVPLQKSGKSIGTFSKLKEISQNVLDFPSPNKEIEISGEATVFSFIPACELTSFRSYLFTNTIRKSLKLV